MNSFASDYKLRTKSRVGNGWRTIVATFEVSRKERVTVNLKEKTQRNIVPVLFGLQLAGVSILRSLKIIIVCIQVIMQ